MAEVFATMALESKMPMQLGAERTLRAPGLIRLSLVVPGHPPNLAEDEASLKVFHRKSVETNGFFRSVFSFLGAF